MERTGKCGLVSFTDTCQGGAAVFTRIDHGMKFTITIAANNQGLTANLNRHKIIVVRNFTFMTGINPDFFKDLLHLQVKQFSFSEHFSSNAEHTIMWTKINTVLNEVLPFSNAA